MGSLRQDLLRAASGAAADLLRRPPWSRSPEALGVVLGGSAPTEHADEYSGCDLFVFRLGRSVVRGAALTWHEVRDSAHPYRYAVLGLAPFLAAAGAGDDEALSLLRHGHILRDSPRQELAEAFAQAWTAAAPLWPGKLAARYRAFRQRRASLAWSLRRGQPLLVLDNIRLCLEHALACAYHLEGEPAPARKWLFRGGLRTAAGRGLREPVLDLLSSLGDLATLGGSLNLRQNRIYRQVDRVQGALEKALLEAGHPVPGLAAQAPAALASGGGGDDRQAPRTLPRRQAVGGGPPAGTA